MKIKRNSWHSKISNFGKKYPGEYPDNLCKYFWRFVGKIVFLLWAITITVSLIFIYFTNPFWICTTIVILWFVLSIFLSILVIWFVRKKFGVPPEIPGENFVIEYIKAKKEKICPFIEYI